MKVLVADAFSPAGITELEEQKLDVVYSKDLSGESLQKALAELAPEVLVVRSTKVTAANIDADPALQLIVRAGAGFDTIDVPHASKQGILVANCPGKNSHAVAELAMGLIVAVDRRLADNVQLLREGKWRKGAFANCAGLKGRTVGVIGLGNIGRLIADRARAFEMEVVGFTRSGRAVEGVRSLASADEVLAASDFVAVCTSANAETKGMVNKDFLAKMKPNATLVNIARSTVVNEDHLLEHLEANKEFFYATDVFQGEPADKSADFESKLSRHPQVYGTHHIGASTKQAEGAIGEEAVRIIKKYVATGCVDALNTVNRAAPATEFPTLSVKGRAGAELYAHVFGVLAECGWRAHEFENSQLANRETALLSVRVEGDMTKKEAVLEKLRGAASVLDAKL